MPARTVIAGISASRLWFHRFAARALAVVRKPLIILLWIERSNERYRLMQLSDRALRDFGCNRCDARREYEKYFWQP